MKAIFKYNVLAKLPERLQPLGRLAYNMWFSWHHDIADLFRQLDSELWEACQHNPVYMLGSVSQKRLEQLAEDRAFLARVDRAHQELERYLSVKPSWGDDAEDLSDFCVAYFSAEFGLAQCLPIYSGGLGLLAGDYLKSASDLNFPAVGVGLFYNEGYFQQYFNAD